MMSSSVQTVVIFGATGAVGTSLCERLAREQPTWKIQAVTRDANGTSRLAQLNLPNVHMVVGNPFDPQDVLKLTREADIIVSCIGFHKYQASYWKKHWPVILENLLAGATQEGHPPRRLVFCDNLYAYGAGHDTPISPTTTSPVPPSWRTKPGIRSHMRQRFQAHMQAYPGTLAVVGASDFFGPHVTATSFLGDTMTGKIVKEGAAPLAIGSATAVHDFCYVPDFAHALAVACTDDRALDKFWVCPHAVKGKTMTEIARDIAAKHHKEDEPNANKPVQVSVLPSFLVYLLSPFMEFMWEMIEMLPFWTKDYRVDDSDFIETFGVQATSSDEALGDLVAFYQEQNPKA